jgi:Zn-dependent protease with chaperone function
VAQAEVRKKRIEPLWDRVDRNRVELVVVEVLFLISCVLTAWFLMGLVLIVVWVASLGTPEYFEQLTSRLWLILLAGGLLALLGGATWVGYALTRSEKWLLERLGAVLAPTGELLPTKYALKDMAIASGFEVAPAMYVMETGNVNAFIFARRDRRAVVGVTRGLVERMDTDEQRAVFANLMARLRAGDIAAATGITALMRPVWGARERDLTRGDAVALLQRSADGEYVFSNSHDVADAAAGGAAATGLGVVLYLLLAGVFVLVTETILYGRRFQDLKRAEKADAEGMLLLKDPRSMLSALEKTVRFNNWVPNAGPAFASLFYCWTGDDTDDEDDPEWRRVTRLREVLGVEGMAPPAIEPNRHVLFPPPAPRVEQPSLSEAATSGSSEGQTTP